MIASLTGDIIHIGVGWILLEVDGVGYQVFVPKHLTNELGQKMRIFCSHQVREDSQTLYGFLTIPERQLFELLLSVGGVGPKSALAIIGIGSIERIETAIFQGEPALFEAVPGIGKKVAARIIVELKTKLGGTGSLLPANDGNDQLVEALMALGYRRPEILRVLAELPTGHKALEEQIRWALKRLAQNQL